MVNAIGHALLFLGLHGTMKRTTWRRVNQEGHSVVYGRDGFRFCITQTSWKVRSPEAAKTKSPVLRVWHLTDQELHVNCLQPNQNVFCDLGTRLTMFEPAVGVSHREVWRIWWMASA